MFDKIVGFMYHLSQISKLFILLQPLNQHLYMSNGGGERNHPMEAGERNLMAADRGEWLKFT